uniref:Uncharacterized protein n=1 Tax=Anguilla anguilla TaxID=7936 RepID=A0A0E9RH73_ANGAN
MTRGFCLTTVQIELPTTVLVRAAHLKEKEYFSRLCCRLFPRHLHSLSNFP